MCQYLVEFPSTRTELNAVFDIFDKHRSGEINYLEFMEALRPERQVFISSFMTISLAVWWVVYMSIYQSVSRVLLHKIDLLTDWLIDRSIDWLVGLQISLVFNCNISNTLYLCLIYLLQCCSIQSVQVDALPRMLSSSTTKSRTNCRSVSVEDSSPASSMAQANIK